MPFLWLKLIYGGWEGGRGALLFPALGVQWCWCSAPVPHSLQKFCLWTLLGVQSLLWKQNRSTGWSWALLSILLGVIVCTLPLARCKGTQPARQGLNQASFKSVLFKCKIRHERRLDAYLFLWKTVYGNWVQPFCFWQPAVHCSLNVLAPFFLNALLHHHRLDMPCFYSFLILLL